MSDKTVEEFQPEFDSNGIGFTYAMSNNTLQKYTYQTFKIPLTATGMNMDPYIAEIGEKHVRPMLEKLNIRSYHQLPEEVASYCKPTVFNSGVSLHKNLDFWDLCFGEPKTRFTKTITSLYEEALRVQKDKDPGSLRRSFHNMIRFVVNDHLSDCCLDVLKSLCTEKELFVATIRDYMGYLYKDTLPTDSLDKLWSNCGMYFVIALVKLHNQLFPVDNSKHFASGHVKLAIVFAYEQYLNVDDWTQKIFRDAFENASIYNQCHREIDRHYRSKLECKIDQALKEAYNRSKDRSALQSLSLPGNGTHQEFVDWCAHNNEKKCGDSFVKFQVKMKNPPPWWWHCIPLPCRFMYKKMLHKLLTVYPGDELPASILRMIVNHNRRRNGDEWSIHTWWNVFVEGCLRHVSNHKGQHLQRGQDFILVGMSPDNDDWHRLTQDLYNHTIPYAREYFRKTLGPVTGNVAYVFGIRDGSEKYQCLGVHALHSPDLQYAPSRTVMQEFVQAFVGSITTLRNPRPRLPFLKSMNFTDRNNPPPIVERDERSGEVLGRSGELEIKIYGPGPGPNGGNGGPGSNGGNGGPGPGPEAQPSDVISILSSTDGSGRIQSSQRVPTQDLDVASVAESIASSLHVSPQRKGRGPMKRPSTPVLDPAPEKKFAPKNRPPSKPITQRTVYLDSSESEDEEMQAVLLEDAQQARAQPRRTSRNTSTKTPGVESDDTDDDQTSDYKGY